MLNQLQFLKCRIKTVAPNLNSCQKLHSLVFGVSFGNGRKYHEVGQPGLLVWNRFRQVGPLSHLFLSENSTLLTTHGLPTAWQLRPTSNQLGCGLVWPQWLSTYQSSNLVRHGCLGCKLSKNFLVEKIPHAYKYFNSGFIWKLSRSAFSIVT